MKKRIFLSITIVSLFSIISLNLIIMFGMYNTFFDMQKENLRDESNNIAEYIRVYGADFEILSAISSYRITIVNQEGKVFFENQTNKDFMSNHLSRPEIAGAFSENYMEDTRISETLGEQSYYYAIKLNDDLVLRTSITIDSVYSMILSSSAFFIGISIIFMIITICISNYLTKIIVKPLNQSEKYDNIYPELLPFVKKIQKQEDFIEKQRLKFEKITNEFNVITENIADGLILLNEENNVISINKKAQNILCGDNLDYSFKNIMEVSRNLELRDSVLKTLDGENSQIELKKNNKIYILHISPVFTEEIVSGTVILIVDNTKFANIEQIRREFSANVSHEIKTPLTTISGYAELLMNGLVDEAHIQPFSENIYNEARHLVDLIEDIIKLSRLDEKRIETDFEEIALDKTILFVIDRLENYAINNNISIHLDLKPYNILGINHIIEEIFYNIIQNAIKYNKTNGEVSVFMHCDNKNAIICIKDTGIGVSEESLERIFERFYRDDKSHNKQIAGSGLGLAIVKHGINLHNGKIFAKSELGKGTEFKIFIPLI